MPRAKFGGAVPWLKYPSHYVAVCFTLELSLHSKNCLMTSRSEGAASATLYLATIPNYFSDLVGLRYRGPAIHKEG